MKFRRRAKRRAIARMSGKLLKAAALAGVAFWAWRTLPEFIRYVKIERM